MNKSYFYLEMKTHELKVPYTGKLRRVRVLLPKNYETDTDRRYPVVYFHDGQNVLYSKGSLCRSFLESHSSHQAESRH